MPSLNIILNLKKAPSQVYHYQRILNMEKLYQYDEEKLKTIKANKPWMTDAKYFKKVKVSPSAAIKMMMHSQHGVDKGIKRNGKPTEVMGMLVGRPDTEDLTSLVIYDAQPLPIEGFETAVVADDETVVNYMIELGESLELTRKEHFCGWYHTHPFDLDDTSHCYLSNTDVTTQLLWQRAEDRNGNPWVAIVIDPLLSLQKGRPEMMSFRAYPPEYIPPSNETPDGRIVPKESKRVELWGNCWNGYYKLETVYFMSSLAQNTLGMLKDKYLWPNVLSGSESQQQERDGEVAELLTDITRRIEALEPKSGNDRYRGRTGDPEEYSGLLDTKASATATASGENLTSLSYTQKIDRAAEQATKVCSCRCVDFSRIITKRLLLSVSCGELCTGSEADK